MDSMACKGEDLQVSAAPELQVSASPHLPQRSHATFPQCRLMPLFFSEGKFAWLVHLTSAYLLSLHRI